MFRFLALFWNPHDPDASTLVAPLRWAWQAHTSRWRAPLVRPGFMVACAGECRDRCCRVLEDDAGVVLGALFDRHGDPDDDSPSRASVLDSRQCTGLLDSHGRQLISHYWGNYVALLQPPQQSLLRVIKDPTGSLPCFMAQRDDVTLIFSDIADAMALHWVSPCMNPAFLAARLRAPIDLPSSQALLGITRLYGGECAEIRMDGTLPRRTLYWRPNDFVDTETEPQTPRLAANRVRATVHACVRSWVRDHDEVLLRCSGGLDSSIIAGCLTSAPSRVRLTAYTYYYVGTRSDARPWARLVTTSAACEHVEIALEPATLRLDTVLQMPRCVEPAGALSFYQRAHLETPLVRADAIATVFCGDGGDSGFGRNAIGDAVTGLLRHRGVRPGILRLAAQVALHTHESVPAVLTRSLHEWLCNRDTHLSASTDSSCQLVSPEVATPAPYSHPWLAATQRTARSLERRLGGLLMPSEYYNAPVHGPAPEIIAPLYAQPVLERLLQIPLHLHFFDGRDRGLARLAFARDVPAPILQRCWKDRAPGFFEALISHHRDFLREQFLDGVLVRERWLDRAALEQALSPGAALKSAVLPSEIFRHLDTELWARHWLAPPSTTSLRS